MRATQGRTLARKVWDEHVVRSGDGGLDDLLYVDLHLLHEVNTQYAFDDLRAAGRAVRRPDLTLAVEDHNTPTRSLDEVIREPAGRRQSALLRRNCAEFGIPMRKLGDRKQGIVHVIAPEQGLVRPGMTIVCCDSHTTTLGAFGAVAFGIGTGQVEHVLATQTLPARRLKDMAATVRGDLPAGVEAKDLALALVARIGTGGAQGHALEYRGPAITAMSMEARMTLCNMAVEAGSKAGVIGPDETTVRYLRDRPGMPADFAAEVERWLAFRTDDDAEFDTEFVIDASELTPFVSWGTNPAQSLPLAEVVPDPDAFTDERERSAARRALDYMDLRPGTAMRDIKVDSVFVGSCTNGRIEDLRAAAAVLSGRKVADGVHLMIVPGSADVRAQAVTEGLDHVFAEAGADFRVAAGCSMCCGLNDDRLLQGQRAASTSNRNFEGRQGKGSRTHLVSPAVAAATAVAGHLAAPSDL
ncbi:3-isopropylmalate dehydratase large subunit [Lentzea sp. NPDC051208]|uniref:3-isopropylmalate dehydratase large subunit n=1 Tax=Lentzea sp. NPDC051208 TaxID=3154642 RepID=UPI00342A3A5F